MEINMLSIGERIKTRRLELHLTQTDIFEKCGIASGVLSRIENGKNVPSIITFYKLSQVLECDMNWLATGLSTNMQNFTFYKNEEELIGDFRKLSDDDKEELIEILHLKLRRSQKTRNVNAKSFNSIDDGSLTG
jgi:transcriptional regulator with XRE-family HTH domain